MAITTAALLAALPAGSQSHADGLDVLYDSGSSIPLAPYLSEIVSVGAEQAVMQGLAFPIRSTLRPGVLATEGTQAIDPRWLVQPMFIVAADARSMRWLEYNQSRLAKLRAVGLVVQADTPGEFKVVQRVAQGLPVAPETGDWLAERLQAVGAGVYPLLVQSDGRVFQILHDEEAP
jgi:integrating conjugative element protein (TIGR03765 family)